MLVRDSVLVMTLIWCSCSDTKRVSCGPGTVEKDGQCVVVGGSDKATSGDLAQPVRSSIDAGSAAVEPAKPKKPDEASLSTQFGKDVLKYGWDRYSDRVNTTGAASDGLIDGFTRSDDRTFVSKWGNPTFGNVAKLTIKKTAVSDGDDDVYPFDGVVEWIISGHDPDHKGKKLGGTTRYRFASKSGQWRPQ